MYMNHHGKDIVIALDSQEEAAALLAVLSGTPTDDKSREFGNRVYAFFYQAIQKLATDFSKEVHGIHPFPHNPRKGRKESL